MPNTVLSVKATKCTQPKSIQNNHQYVRILTRMGRSTGNQQNLICTVMVRVGRVLRLQ